MTRGEEWIVASQPTLESQLASDMDLIPVVRAVYVEERLFREQFAEWKSPRNEEKLEHQGRCSGKGDSEAVRGKVR